MIFFLSRGQLLCSTKGGLGQRRGSTMSWQLELNALSKLPRSPQLSRQTSTYLQPHTSTSRPPSLESSPTMEDPTPPLPDSPPSYSFMTSLFNPSLPVLVAAVFVIFLTPLFLHLFVFNSRAASNLPTFLLVGPAGGGKTSLMTAVRPPAPCRAPPTC